MHNIHGVQLNITYAMRRFILLTVILVLAGCRDEKETDDVVSQTVETDKFFKYSVKFPDTVYVNELNDGEIIYESPFDTITDNFSDPIQDRYVVFRTLPNSSYSFYKDFYNDSLQEYRIGAIDNRTIPFYDLTFQKAGNYKIDGLINDLVLIEPQTKNNSDKTKVRLIETDFPMFFNVVVIEY